MGMPGTDPRGGSAEMGPDQGGLDATGSHLAGRAFLKLRDTRPTSIYFQGPGVL